MVATEPPHPGPKAIHAQVLAAGFLLHLLLGTPYAYPLLRPSFAQAFGLGEVAAALPFSVILAFYTLGMLAGGWGCDRFGPRAVGLVGCVLFGGGYALAGWSPSFLALLASYGALCGFGIGLGYMAAVNSAVRQHPDRKGMATGVVVLGFGLSSAVFALIVPGLIASLGWRNTLVILGTVFTALSLVLCLVLDPRGAELEPGEGEAPVHPPLGLAWLAWALVLTVGLGWLAQLPELARNRGFDPLALPLLVTSVALANGFSRPVLGVLADRVGRFRILTSACVLGAAALVLALAVGGSSVLWGVGIAVGLSFGGWLVNVAPVASEFGGPRRAGTVYGLLFTSYGVGALCGPLAIAFLRTLRPDDAWGLASSVVLLLAAGALFVHLDRHWARVSP